MKKTKKFLAFLLAMVMMLAMGMTAMAATIEFKNVIEGETYTAYRILFYSDNGKTGDERVVSYYLYKDNYNNFGSILEQAGFNFTPSADGTQYFVNNADSIDVAAAAAYLSQNVTSLDQNTPLGKYNAQGQEDGTASFGSLPTGYYFVTSTAGSLCTLHEDTDLETLVEKNTLTTTDKKQGEVAGTYSDAQLDMNIGDTVYYDAEIIIGKGATYQITGTDTLSTGLTLNHANGDITVKLNGTDIDATNYTLTATDNGFTIVFKDAYVATLKENDIIKIEYSAIINNNALIRDENQNEFSISYPNHSFYDETVVKTYDAQLKKVDATTTEFLNGAGFKLYDAATGGNQIKLEKDSTGYYVSNSADTEIMVTSADGVNIRGLAPGTYYLEETTVPAGYNKLDTRVSFTIEKDATAAAVITVENEAGSLLPSTGGIGTTMFYVIGGALVLVAVVLLVTRKRMSVEK